MEDTRAIGDVLWIANGEHPTTGFMPDTFAAYALVPHWIVNESGEERILWTDAEARTGTPMKEALTTLQPKGWERMPFGCDEGNLILATASRIATHLVPVTGDQPCYFHFYFLTLNDWDAGDLLVKAPLTELQHVWQHRDARLSPTHWWPEDRSWLVCTDYDLCYTLVGGSQQLVDAVIADEQLEAVSCQHYGFHPRVHPNPDYS